MDTELYDLITTSALAAVPNKELGNFVTQFVVARHLFGDDRDNVLSADMDAAVGCCYQWDLDDDLGTLSFGFSVTASTWYTHLELTPPSELNSADLGNLSRALGDLKEALRLLETFARSLNGAAVDWKARAEQMVEWGTETRKVTDNLTQALLSS